MYSLQPSLLFINLTNSTGASFIFNGSGGDFVGNKLIGNISINMTGRQKWSIVLTLRYNCRSLNSPVKIFCKSVSLY